MSIGSTLHHNPSQHYTPQEPRPQNHRPLEDLYRRPQWVVWKLEDRKQADGNIKQTKVPYTPKTGTLASSTKPATWGTYAEASTALAAGRYNGLGYVFSAEDDFFGIDFDGCRNAETGEVDPRVEEIVDTFGTYLEISQSKTGLHLIGRGKKPGTNCECKRDGLNIEIYDQVRFFTMSLIPEARYDRVRDCQKQLDNLYAQLFPPVTRPEPSSEPIRTCDFTNDEILDIAFRSAKGPRIRSLFEGDKLEFHSTSEARMSLLSLLAFYAPEVEQLASLLQLSGFWTPKLESRPKLVRTEAQKAIDSLNGVSYDPNYRSPRPYRITPPPPPGTNTAEDDPALDAKTPAELKAIIREQTAIIEAERAARIAAEERAETLAIEKSRAMQVLRNPDLSIGERLTGFAIALDMHARVANGEQPKETGFKAPAIRYAEMTGQSEGTAAKHMRSLNDKGLISKHVIKEQTEREVESDVVDQETGEIQTERETVRGLRDVNYIEVPDGKVINIIDRLVTYQRPDDADKHGGKRDPRPKCEHHPDAGTVVVRSERVECACCRMILEEKEPIRTYFPAENPEDESSGSKLIAVVPVSNRTLSGSKLIAETELATPEPPTGSIMQSEPNAGTLWQPTTSNQCTEADCTNQISPHRRYLCDECAERLEAAS